MATEKPGPPADLDDSQAPVAQQGSYVVGPSTFARLPTFDQVQRADIAVLGVPFDTGTSYRPGARFGPTHVRSASRLLRAYNPVLEVEPFAEQQVVDAGDVPCTPYNIMQAIQEIDDGAREVLQRSDKLLTIGGDHTIALPLLRVMHEMHGEVAVIHFDAHLDTWESRFGSPITHGTPFRRASEEGLIDKTGSVHVGIRGPIYAAQDLTDDEVLGFQLLEAHAMDEMGWRGVAERIASRVGNRPAYVSIDIDVLDPAFAPGTGTPEPGGLNSRELLNILRSFTSLNVVGADIVEVSPAYDHAEITGFAAAHAAYELLSAMSPSSAASSS